MNILCIGDVVGSQRLPVPAQPTCPPSNGPKAIDLVDRQRGKLRRRQRHHPRLGGIPVRQRGGRDHHRQPQLPPAGELRAVRRAARRCCGPANFPAAAPGRGLCVVDLGRAQVAVINLMGTAYMESLRCPFETLEALLKTPDLPKVVIVDFHAEATGEKRALGFFADGKVTALFGTHTHVPTADDCLLPHGTGYHHRRGDDRGHRLGAGGEAGDHHRQAADKDARPVRPGPRAPARWTACSLPADEAHRPVHRRGADVPHISLSAPCPSPHGQRPQAFLVGDLLSERGL